MRVRRVGFGVVSLALAGLLVVAAGAASGGGVHSRCADGSAWTAAGRAPGVVAAELAGDEARLQQVLDCWGVTGQGAGTAARRADVHDGLGADAALVGAYVVVLLWWCRYGVRRGWSPTVRAAGRTLGGVAVVAGLFDLMENSQLARAVDGEGGLAVHITAFSVAKWALLVLPVAYALAMVVLALGRGGTLLLGGARGGLWAPAVPPRAPAASPDPERDLGLPHEPRRAALSDSPADSLGRTPAHRERQFLAPDGELRERATLGIAISGGGIRSATYGSGALQVLETAGIVGRARYLASVSGGGYLAVGREVVRRSGTTTGTPTPVDAAPFADGTPETAYLRTHHRYLWDTPSAAAGGIGRVLLSICFNLGVVGSLLFLASWSVGWLIRIGALTGRPGELALGAGHLRGIGLAVVVAGVASALHVQLTQHLGGWRARAFAGLAPVGTFAIALVWLAALDRGPFRWDQVLWILAAVPVVIVLAAVASTRHPRAWTRALGLSAPGVALTVLGLALAGAFARQSATRDPLDRDLHVHALVGGLWWTAIGIVVLGAVVGAVTLALGDRRRRPTSAVAVVAALAVLAVHVLVRPDWVGPSPREAAAVGVLALLVALTYAFVDQKRWSPHVFYKKRLSTAFALARHHGADQDPEAGEPATEAQEVPFAVRTALSSWFPSHHGTPQLVVSAAVHTSNPVLRRDARVWPFSFEREWVGGPDVGWMRTIDFEAALGRANGGDGTAMAAAAISGAAVASSLGVMSKGSTNALLALGNLRLGVWLPSPFYVNRLLRCAPEEIETWVRWRRFSYLLKEVIGRFDLHDRFVYVSDGGHLENFALIELLQRRCRLIVVVDASGDKFTPSRPETAAGTLRSSMRQAYFHTGVTFHDAAGRPLLTEDGAVTDAFGAAVVALGPVGAHDRSPVSHVTVTARYPDLPGMEGEEATILVVKSLVTDAAVEDAEEGEQIVAARAHSARFPRNSTGNQWLADELFDGYRALGRQNARAALPDIEALLAAAEAAAAG